MATAKHQDLPPGYRPVEVTWKDLDKCNVCHMDEVPTLLSFHKSFLLIYESFGSFCDRQFLQKDHTFFELNGALNIVIKPSLFTKLLMLSSF